MKKQIITFCLSLMAIGANSQNIRTEQVSDVSNSAFDTHPCRTATPPKEWDDWFDSKVEEYKHNHAANKVMSTFTLPVIVHIIHKGGTPVGTSENISQAQVQSQITVLNKVFSGNNTTSIPPVFQPVNAGNIGIQFCLVQKAPNGSILAETGIERINWTAKGWGDPATMQFDSIQTYFDEIIKPATIWDPTKYLNFWITDEDTISKGSYCQFPIGTGLNGLEVDALETDQTSGAVFYHKMFGTTGTILAPYDKGITAVHEIGHYLGLRHIFGDRGEQCGNDHCDDTPPQSGGYNNPLSSANKGCPPAGWKGVNGICYGNNYGEEMFMNYMDYTADGCKSLFTADQKTRMLTALAYGSFRKYLGMDGFCNSSPIAPVANFTFPQNLCNKNTGYTFSDASQNQATSWAWSVVPATGVNINSTSSQNPNISFLNPGNYTIALKATNNVGTSIETKTIVVRDCIDFECDTLKNCKKLALFVRPYKYDKRPPLDSGYVSGSNYRKDKAIAEMYINTGNTNKLSGIYSIFGPDSIYGKNPDNLTLKVWDDVNGKPGNVLASLTVPFYKLYTQFYNGFYFPNPVTVPGKYYVGFDIPQLVNKYITCLTNDTTIPQNNPAPNTGWVQDKNGQWYTYGQVLNRANLKLSNAIYPIMCKDKSSGLMEENTITEIMTIYPNPGSGQIHFQFGITKKTEIEYSIFNALGQNMLEGKKNLAGNTEFELNLSQLPKGVYFIRLTDNDKNIFGFKKFILE